MPVTLRQIAERVGCSRSTVSYALRNSPNISRGLRERILTVAEEFGWKPDANLAKQMALVRQTVTKKDLPHLAIVINKANQELALEPSPSQHLSGAKEYAERMGFHADIFNLAETPLSPKRLKNILIARGIQGIIFVGTVCPELAEEYLEIGQEFAAAIVGLRYPNLPFHVVINDHLGAGRLAILKILEAGYKRLAIILPRGVDSKLGYAYTGGFTSGLVEIPPEDRLPIQYVGTGESHIPEYEMEQMRHWLRWKRPEAVLTTDIEHSLILQREMEQEGLRFELFSADWQPEQPVKGGVNLRQTRLGEAAVDVVVAQLHRGTFGLPRVQRSIHVGGIWKDQEEDFNLEGRDAKVPYASPFTSLPE